MKSIKPILLSATLAAAACLAPAAHGQTVNIAAAGSTAVFNSIADDAVNQVPATCGAFHWTKKNHGWMHDSRKGNGVTNIVDEKANIWITWNGAASGTGATVVCAYVAVDSGIGVRGFMAVPRASIYTDSPAATAGDNLVSTIGADSPLPANILAALNTTTNLGTTLNIAFSDVRPEDAQYAHARMLSNLTANRSGLGYGNWPNPFSTPADGFTADVLQGSSLLSSYSTKVTTPDWFEISPLGTDPITGQAVVRWQTYPVGAVPLVIFVSNEDNSATGFGSGLTPAETAGSGPWTAGPYAANNINMPTAGYVFDGSLTRTVDILSGGQTAAASCSAEGSIGGAAGGKGSNNCALTVLTREALSGTYNAFEFTVPRTHFLQLSQEDGVNPTVAADNPLAITAADGSTRLRGIGTGEIVNGVCGNHISTGSNPAAVCTAGPTTGTATANRIGYAFWSYANFAPVTGIHGGGTGATYDTQAPWAHYLTLNGIDPLFSTPSANPDGALNPPICLTTPCPSITFPHLVDGSYQAWTVVQAIVNSTVSVGDGSPQDTLLSKLPNSATNFSDFLPVAQMQFFRAHRDANVVGIGARNGNGCPAPGVLNYGDDFGQSAGGMIFSIQNDLDYAFDNGAFTSTCTGSAPADAGLTNLTQ